MLLISHIALGILIGYYISPIWLIILLSIASHFLLDAIPHWDPDYKSDSGGVNLKQWKNQSKKVRKQIIILTLVQFILVMTIIALIYKDIKFEHMFIGGLFAALPDFYEWLAGLIGLPSIHIYKKLLKHRQTNWKKGAIIQIITSATSLFPILRIILRASGK